MNEFKAFELFRNLKEAWASTSRRFNHFAELVYITRWDNQFTADGEMYFEKDGLLLCVQSLDTFAPGFDVPTVIIGTRYYDIRGKKLAV